MLCHCSAPGTALLGPAFTGATSKSVAQTSLSFGTNRLVSSIREASENSKNEVIKIVRKLDDFAKDLDSKDFYVSVKSLYLQDKHQKREKFLFHR